jgi:putative phage-type endonuclease
MTAIPGPIEHSKEWEAIRTVDLDRDRPVVIGASEIAAVCGASPYCTPLQYFLQKLGRMPKEFTDEQRERMRWGSLLENVIITEYMNRRPGTYVAIRSHWRMFFSAKHEWMAATPDAILIDPDGHEYGIECKCASDYMVNTDGTDPDKFGEPETDQVPVSYYLQAQQQMCVMDWGYVVFPVLVNGSKLLTYTVHRNEETIETIIESGEEMVRRLIEDDAPEPVFSADAERLAIQSLYGFQAGTSLSLTAEDDSWVDEYLSVNEQIKRLEKIKTLLYNRVLNSMHGSAKATLPSGRKLSRSIIADSYVTEKDVEELAARLGDVKRKGHERLNFPRNKSV